MSQSHNLSPRRARIARVALQLGLPVLGVFLLTLGLLGTVSYGALPLVEVWRSRDWRPAPAAVEAVVVRPPASVLLPPFASVEIRYRYERDGVVYRSARLDPHNGMFVRSESQTVADELRRAAQLTVWVNPSDPSDAIMLRDLRWGVLLFAVPALAMVMAGALLLFAGMLAWNNLGGIIRNERAVRRD